MAFARSGPGRAFSAVLEGILVEFSTCVLLSIVARQSCALVPMRRYLDSFARVRTRPLCLCQTVIPQSIPLAPGNQDEL
jgi:hypothetical protein